MTLASFDHDVFQRQLLEAMIAARKAAGPLHRRLVSVQLSDPEPLLYHAEVLRRDELAVGYLRAGSYGHTVGAAVGLAIVEGAGVAITPAWLAAGAWTVEVNGSQYAASVSLRPLYDPTNARIKM